MKKKQIILITILSIIFVIPIIWFLFFVYQVLEFNANGPEPPQITELEQKWKKLIEKKHHIKIKYLGRDTDYRQDSVLYININYKNSPSLKKIVQDDIESITSNLSKSYLKNTSKDPNLKYILVYYSDFTDTEIETEIPQTKRPHSYRCVFDVIKHNVIPQIKRLEIPNFRYGTIDEESGNLVFGSIGFSLSESRKYAELIKEKKLKKINSNDFKGIPNCEEYRMIEPKIINLKNGIMKCYYNYVFHDDQNISTTITYVCIPSNKSFTYKEVIEKLTINPRNKYNSKEAYYIKINSEYLNTKYLNYQKSMFNVLVKTEVDTSSHYWEIKYETSLDKAIYYTDIDYKFENL